MKNRIVYIAAALDCIRLINEYTKDYQFETFIADKKTQDAVIRNIEVIGQALKDYGVDSLIDADPSMPWIQMAGMRNILAHEYLGVDVNLVWEVVASHLIPLQRALERIKQSNHQND